MYCCCDGGHQFSVMGWPLIVKGNINRNGQLGPAELMLTSTMTIAHVEEAMTKSVLAAEKRLGIAMKHNFSMSDAEHAIMQGLRKAHGSSSVMCLFHVSKDWRKYLFEHASQLVMAHRRILWIKIVRHDLWTLHNSFFESEFKSKWATISKQWLINGVSTITS